MELTYTTKEDGDSYRFGIEKLNDVFEYAGPSFFAATPLREPVESFGLDDIAEVLAGHSRTEEGYGQEDIVALVRLRDGRFAAFAGGCDTTGWDCQSWCDIRVGENRRDVIVYGFDDEDRRRLLFDSPWPGPSLHGMV